MELKVLNKEGQEIKSLSVPDEVFNHEMNEAVLHSAVKAYRANQRQGTHATKTRSMVSGSGKKPFRQKGTGNARQGSSRSPLMPGGAICHGPQPRDYSEKQNKKAKQLAMRVVLSEKARHNALVVVDDLSFEGISTKQVSKASRVLAPNAKSVLFADAGKNEVLYKSARNLANAKPVNAGDMNVYEVLKYHTVVMSEAAVQAVVERLKGDK